ncbi:MAG: TGS domain-containing protein [Armatimonadota bacterium]|nr:TGS domain-containing protein [Armatimonadota bacterium]
MPANLTPQYKEAEERYRQAKTFEEKLAALEEMLAVIPKHKGTEHMQGDIKRRIAKLKEQEEQRIAKGKRSSSLYNVEKEGGGQVVLVGPANSGKSKLLSRVTNAQPEIGEYPYTTQKPLPGMMEYEDIQFQIVDMPPITEEFTEPWMAAIARNADGILFVLDVSNGSVLEEIESTLRILEKFRVRLYGWDRPVPKDELGIVVPKKTILVANKMDCPESAENLEVIRELYGDRFPIIPVSSETGRGLEDLKQQVFRMLDVVRIYTKIPGKPADMDTPYVVPRGTTVIELATMIHKDFAEKLRYARIWGASKFEGQMVSRDHVLEDRDIIELHV